MSAKPFPGKEVLVCRSVPSRRPIAHREKGQAGLLARTQFKSSQHVERALKGQIPPVGFLRRCFIRSQVVTARGFQPIVSKNFLDMPYGTSVEE